MWLQEVDHWGHALGVYILSLMGKTLCFLVPYPPTMMFCPRLCPQSYGVG